MNQRPPKWVDRFLTWYCNPDLLEEIQGDAYELYEYRVQNTGRFKANWRYLWDVIRFCRWSNIQRENNDFRPGFIEILLNLNFKIALRNATRNKFIFFVKVSGLAMCLAFATALIGFVISEYTFDRHFKNYDLIYRIGSGVNSNGLESNYAVSPLKLADALMEEAPEVERAARLMATFRPEYEVGDDTYYNCTTFSADTTFLRIFSYQFIAGTVDALDYANQVVLTESTAKRFFGNETAMGKTLLFNDTRMEVTAVLADPSPRSHLQFDALISWDTFRHGEEWDNVNAYTYVKVKDGASREQFRETVTSITKNYLELIISEYELTYKPIIQRLDEIHLSPPMDEDLADRGQKSNLYILIAVVVLFFVTGLINYLNITLAELTTAVKKFTILRIFGGLAADSYKVAVTDSLIGIAAIVPLFLLFIYFLLSFARSRFGIVLDDSVWTHPAMFTFVLGFPVLMIVASWANALFISSSGDTTRFLKGDTKIGSGSFSARQYLLAAQLSFSVVMIALMSVIVDQFRFIQDSEKGFKSDNLVVLEIPRYDGEDDPEVLMESIRKKAGVDLVEGCSYMPGGDTETKEFFELQTDQGMKKTLVNYMTMGYDYAELLQLKLAQGRLFDRELQTDKMGAYIINEAAVKQFGWKDPVGKKINGPLQADGREGQVIGVLKDFHYASLHNKIEPIIIFLNWNRGADFVYLKLNPLRPDHLLSQIEEDYRKVFPNLPMKLSHLDSRYLALYKEDIKLRKVFEIGLVVSVILSSLGIFSISALLLIKRRKEMGIRKVVGASRIQLFIIHIKTFLIFLGVASLLAVPAIYFLSDRWLNNFAYHIHFSVRYFIFPTLVTSTIILLVSGAHALKSSLVNPVEVLKEE
jgi:putative ABC transport system permease protein